MPQDETVLRHGTLPATITCVKRGGEETRDGEGYVGQGK